MPGRCTFRTATPETPTFPPASVGTSPPKAGFAPPEPGIWTFNLALQHSTFATYSDDVDAPPLDSGDGGAVITSACGARCVAVQFGLGFAVRGIFELHQVGHTWRATIVGSTICVPSMRASAPSVVTERWTAYFTQDGRTLWGRITANDSSGCEPGHGTAIVWGSWQATP